MAIALLIFMSAALAAEPSSENSPTPAEIAAAIERLGSDRYEVREAASKFLWQVGRPAQGALEAAAQSRDAEVARRAQRLLEAIRFSITPDTPPEVADLVRQYRRAATNAKHQLLNRLVELERYEYVVELLRGEQDPSLRRRITQHLRPVRRAAIEALADGDLHRGERFFEWIFELGDDRQSLADYAVLIAHRGAEVERIAALRKRLALQFDEKQAQLLARLLFLRGEFAEAEAVARRTADQPLLLGILFRRDDWAALAAASADPAKDRNVEYLGFQMKFQRLAGNEPAFAAELDKLRRYVRSTPEDPSSGHSQAFEACLLNEAWKEAEEFAPYNVLSAFEWYAALRRYDEAFRLIGLPQGPEGACEWFAARAEDGDLSTNELATHYKLAVLVGRTLYHLGEVEQGKRLFALINEQGMREKSFVPWREIVEAELRLELRDEADRIALRLADDENIDMACAGAYFKTQWNIAQPWWRALHVQYPNEDRPARWQRLQQLFSKQQPSRFDEAELRALARHIEVPAMKKDVQVRTIEMAAIADVLRIQGQHDLAIRYYQMEADADVDQNGKPQVHPEGTSGHRLLAYLKIGDIHREQKKWTEAAAAYDDAWKAGRDSALAAHLRGYCLLQSGDEAAGRRVLELAKLLPLGNVRRRDQLADELAERGLERESLEERATVLRLTPQPPGDYHAANAAQKIAAHHYNPPPRKSERLWRNTQCGILSANAWYVAMVNYSNVGLSAHRAVAYEHLRHGRYDEACEEVGLAHAAKPTADDFAIDMVPRLAAVGRASEAAALFDGTFDRFAAVCRLYPRAADDRNRAAWIAASCNRRLKEAFQFAEQAVGLRPDNASYRDTLAYLHYRRGDYAAAIAEQQRALALKPTDQELQRHLRLFEEAVSP
jgi:hypothetical protein